MSIRRASARWQGTLKEGRGVMHLGKGTSFEYTHGSRFGEDEGANPEQLIGAAYAGCYSMFLSALLSNASFVPESIETTAAVALERLDDGPKIISIALECKAQVPGVSAEEFQRHAQAAREKCPVSKLYTGTEVTLKAELVA